MATGSMEFVLALDENIGYPIPDDIRHRQFMEGQTWKRNVSEELANDSPRTVVIACVLREGTQETT